MFRNNYNQGNQQFNGPTQTNVNTRLIRLFADDSSLEVSGWNDKIAIKLRPFIGKNSSGMNTYEREDSKIINTAISLDNIASLNDAIENDFKPAMKNGEPMRISVPINNSNTTGSKKILSFITEPEHPIVLEIACNVGEDNISIPQYTKTYTFKERVYYKNYVPETGEYDDAKMVSEANIIFDLLKKYASLMPVEYHASKYSKATTYTGNNVNRGSNNTSYQQANYQQVNNNYQQSAPITQGGEFDDADGLPF